MTPITQCLLYTDAAMGQTDLFFSISSAPTPKYVPYVPLIGIVEASVQTDTRMY